MNKINQNGVKVIQTENSIIVNGIEYPLPEKVKNNGANRMTMINGRITINGFVFNPHTGKFTRAFPWIWVAVAAIVLYLVFG